LGGWEVGKLGGEWKLKAQGSKEIISHPDEIEKKKHFIGQADSHGRTQTIKFNAGKLGGWEAGKLGGEWKLKAQGSKEIISHGHTQTHADN
jgi:hypothetical protein